MVGKPTQLPFRIKGETAMIYDILAGGLGLLFIGSLIGLSSRVGKHSTRITVIENVYELKHKLVMDTLNEIRQDVKDLKSRR